MKHYLVYHSAARMGFSFRDDGPDDSSEPYRVVTKKNLKVEPGDVVWLISGEKPEGGGDTDYRLEYWFFIEGKQIVEDPDFAYLIHGKRGATFSGGIRLTREKWFQDFREDQLNFRGGMQTIAKPILQRLYAACRTASAETPTAEFQQPGT